MAVFDEIGGVKELGKTVARVTMYISPDWFDKYQQGKVSWGISEEGRVHYPYMRMQVQIHASEVIGIELKTIEPGEDYNEIVNFVSYDIRRRPGYGD